MLKSWKRGSKYYARFLRDGKIRVLSLGTEKKNVADKMLEKIQEPNGVR